MGLIFEENTVEIYEKISACIRAIVMTIFEEDVDIILQQLASHDSSNYESSSTNTNETDTELLRSLADSYSKANKKTDFVCHFAKKHSSKEGCGMPPKNREDTRNRMDHAKLDSFLDFITSSHVIKNLPFWREKIKAKRWYKTPNIIRYMGPSAIVDQYKQYCKENDFNPLGFLLDFGDWLDHCRKYALSSQDQDHFQSCCDHDHDHVCEHCEQISELLHAISKLVNECQVPDKDIYLYKFSQAKEKILNWKCHIIRSRNQGAAKSDLLDSLEESEVVIVLDWAMKYLPRRYREDQSNWYAKRGISWHIGVAFRRTGGNLQSLTFVHIFHSQISQDSVTTTSVILDIVEDLNTKYEDISKVHLWSDNAGCYKCTDTINAIAMSGKIAAYNFCEAQDGKGACDRTAATLKAGIRRHIN
ncbi:unnamed protein product [Mytilus edulis]|uniref:Uncharacterized protein n=1 Tax=Mytilus edulis TaxID=6550 RepID=A0A8S3TD86_MYTED|nr:unnamed protein product [Mytilus edulis]